ncbi:MAG: LPS-assembly protein LptD [Burkholderiaceae bacterium]|nr:LPS-assembly protein LptD [Burkholderiaceae bacterium]
MRWVWWAIPLALCAATSVQAQQASPATVVSAASPGLKVSSKLGLHSNVGDDEIASFMTADSMETDSDGKAILKGNAEVRRIDSVVKGDRIEYQRSTGDVHVRGNGRMMQDGSIVVGPELDYNINSESGKVTTPDFWLGANAGSGKASNATMFNKQHMRLNDVTYSGCPCPDPAWYIRSPQVDLHFDENEGIARHGTLFFKGVPLMYSPYLSFPIRKERKSGFLLPTYGTTSKGGFDFSLPYYLNLAPNYDATITPRIMSKRGVQLGTEFRYLGKRYSGQLYGTYLHNDRVVNDDRWYYAWQHRHALGGGFSANVDIRRVSDDDYFRDFSSFGLNEATNTYLPSSVGLNWGGNKYFSASVYARTYQTLQDQTANYLRPQYNKLPELYVRGAHYDWGGFDVTSENYATRFRMPFYSGRFSEFDAFRDTRIAPNGTRFSSYNAVSYPIVRPGWYVTPKVGVHLSQYNTDWYEDQLTQFAGRPKTQSRVLPIMSVDSGMTFERPTTLFGNDSIQTLEPRVYYLKVPYKDQSQIPLYDTSIATFNFAQAFDENIFSGGWDRISNADQLTVGLTTRWLDEDTGFERLSLSAAQRLYFEDQKVALGQEKLRTDTKSDYLMGATAALTDKLSVRFDAQFNPENNDRNRMTAGFRWEPKRLANLSASYRYERDPNAISDRNALTDPKRTREQVSLSGQWPLTRKLYAMGRVDYSLQEKRSTQSIVGLEYKGDCCWTGRVVMQRYAVSQGDANSAIFFQLELSGLGSIGTDPMGLLRDRISGYQSINPPVPEQTTFERYE